MHEILSPPITAATISKDNYTASQKASKIPYATHCEFLPITVEIANGGYQESQARVLLVVGLLFMAN